MYLVVRPVRRSAGVELMSDYLKLLLSLRISGCCDASQWWRRSCMGVAGVVVVGWGVIAKTFLPPTISKSAR